MIDNTDSSPEIILARARAGTNQDRLSLELALLPSDVVQSVDANANSAGTSNAVTSSTSLVTVGGSGGGSVFPCFTGETTITGNDIFYRIDEIKEGDVVAAFKINREVGFCKVVKVFIHEVVEFLRVELEDGTILNITPEHKVYDGEGFKAIQEFNIGDWLFVNGFTATPIVNIYRLISDKPILVYNFETQWHTYFANGVAVSNLKSPDAPL